MTARSCACPLVLTLLVAGGCAPGREADPEPSGPTPVLDEPAWRAAARGPRHPRPRAPLAHRLSAGRRRPLHAERRPLPPPENTLARAAAIPRHFFVEGGCMPDDATLELTLPGELGDGGHPLRGGPDLRGVTLTR